MADNPFGNREVIRQMAHENPGWGAPRICGELLKLGFDVSERTVSRYMPRRRPDGRKAQSWKSFLLNHREAIAAMDFFVVPTARFKLLYGFFIIAHGRRRIVHLNATEHPTSEWVAQQLREAFSTDHTIKYLVHDCDSIFGKAIDNAIRSIGIEPVRTTWKSPWQNSVAERWVGNIRRDLLDHVIIANEKHLRRLARQYVEYHNQDRCHYALGEDTPDGRPVQARLSPSAQIEAIPKLGGLHHRYQWCDAP